MCVCVLSKTQCYSMNLREYATSLAHQNMKNTATKTQNQKTLLFVGSKSVGKTTLINRFLDRNEPAKKTLSLEYTFARRTSSHSLSKDVCHIWELGGGTLFTSVFESGNSVLNYGSLSMILMLDLSELGHLWYTLEFLLDVTKKLFNSAIGNSSRVITDHPDKGMMDPFPVPLLIIGGKYDIFQEYEPEKKKIVCRCLRYVSHLLCASLVFYSSKDATLVRRVKDFLSHHAFGSQIPKTNCQDYNKAICIPCGSDFLDAIEGFGGSKYSIEKVMHVYTTHFPQDILKSCVPITEDPANDPSFREPLIDTLRRQKDEELKRYCQEIERRAKQII